MMSNQPSVPQPRSRISGVLSAYASLFASFTTLFCCALPSLLVLVGFGFTSVLGVFVAIPGWQHVGQYDIWLFVLSATLLATGFVLTYRDKRQELCEIPAEGPSSCSVATLWNRRILWFSLVLFLLALVMNFWGIGWMKAHGYFSHLR